MALPDGNILIRKGRKVWWNKHLFVESYPFLGFLQVFRQGLPHYDYFM